MKTPNDFFPTAPAADKLICGNGPRNEYAARAGWLPIMLIMQSQSPFVHADRVRLPVAFDGGRLAEDLERISGRDLGRSLP